MHVCIWKPRHGDSYNQLLCIYLIGTLEINETHVFEENISHQAGLIGMKCEYNNKNII